MQGCVEAKIIECVVAVAPGVLQLPADLAVHLHERREAAELRPAHEQVGRRLAEVRVLVAADVVAPDRVAAHRCGLAGHDHARQPVVAEIGLVVAGPAAGKRVRAGEAAAREQQSRGAEHVPDGLVVLQAVPVAHFDAGAPVAVHGRRRDVGVRPVAALAIVGLEAADRRLGRRRRGCLMPDRPAQTQQLRR